MPCPQQIASLQDLQAVPGDVRRQEHQRAQEESRVEKPSESEEPTMGQVIAMPRKENVAGPNLVYVYGETILSNWHLTAPLRDSEGHPVQPKGFYEVTRDYVLDAI